MKKSTRSTLLLILALLMISVPMTASAEVVEGASVPTAKVSWEENLMPCTATLRFPENAYVIPVPIKDATIVRINNGEQGVTTWPIGNCATQTPTFTEEPSMLNKERLETLSLELGYEVKSMNSVVPDFEYYTIPAGLIPGEYSYGTEFGVMDAEWWITRGALSGRIIDLPVGANQGEIIGIPYEQTALKLIVISLD